MNIDALPAGKSLYTVHVTLDPEGTPRSEMAADEVDVVAGSRASWGQVVSDGVENDGGANAGGYIWATYGENARVVGVVNQSDGFVLFDAFKAGIETGADDMKETR